MDQAPSYRDAGRNVHVVEIENIGAALEHEAQGYVLHMQDAEEAAEPAGEVHSGPEPSSSRLRFVSFQAHEACSLPQWRLPPL